MTSPTAWRLLRDPRAAGCWNMAVDEALLEGYAGAPSGTPPTLRLYGWAPAALSLGRNQPAEGAHDPWFLEREGIDLVRRPTGGRAVLHEHERTYAVVGQLGVEPFPGAVVDTYRRVADALVRGLALLGVQAESAGEVAQGASPRSVDPSCFATASTHEITARRRKLVGAAQLRRRRAFLQHGSILVRCSPDRLASALGGVVDEESFVGLESLLGSAPDDVSIDRALVRGFEVEFCAAFRAGKLRPVERRRAERLAREKYGTPRWTIEGRS